MRVVSAILVAFVLSLGGVGRAGGQSQSEEARTNPSQRPQALPKAVPTAGSKTEPKTGRGAMPRDDGAVPAAQANGAPSAADRALETEIRSRLRNAVIGQDGFTLAVRDGIAYWSGDTTVSQHKGAATRMARSAGARGVVNNIRYVRAPGSGVSPTASTPTANPATNPATNPPAPWPPATDSGQAAAVETAAGSAGDPSRGGVGEPSSAQPVQPRRVRVQWRDRRPNQR